MRFLELGLLAYGPFTGVKIDLRAPPPALHLIHGRNEAGKSTTLRALGDVLFEIPPQTADAYVHAMSELRLSAVLLTAAGEQLEIQRRKGKSGKTLLDAAGAPIEEATLQRVLGGIDRGFFETMFALSHERLRRGAEALLEGRGDVRESLYDAGTGGRGIHEVLARLEAEAEAIFKERGQKLRLNVAIADFADAKRRSLERSQAASAYEAQVAERDRLRGERERVDRRRREVNEEAARLQRWLRVLPHLDERRTLLARRSALGEVVALGADAAERRARVERELHQLGHDAGRLAGEIELAEVRRRAIPEASSLAEVDEARVDRLMKDVGAIRDAAEDLPKRKGELSVLLDDERGILRQLGRDDAGGAAEVRLDKAASTRVRKLAQERAGVDAAIERLRRELAGKQAKVEREARRVELPPRPAPAVRTEPATGSALAALEAAVQRARRAGDVEGAVRAAELAVERLEAAARREMAGLALGDEIAAAVERAVPVPAVVDRFVRENAAIEAERARLAERGQEVEAQSARAEKLADELRRAGDVPTEAGLAEARGRRDELWKVIRAKASAARGRPSGGELDAFEGAGREADGLADRLRREAERVARLAAALAETEAAERARVAVGAARAEIARRAAELDAAWREVWAPSGVAAGTPPEMQQWLVKFAKLVEVAGERDRAVERRDGERARSEALGRELAGAMAAVDPPAEASLPGVPGLAALVDRAAHVLASAQRVQQERRRHAEMVEELLGEIAQLEAEIGDREAAREAWTQHWIDAVVPLGIAAEQDPDVAVELLDEIAALGRKREEIVKLRWRIDGMERDAAVFADEVRAIARVHAPDLADSEPVAAAAEELVRRWRQVRQDREQRDSVEGKLDELREQAAQVELRRSLAAEQLADLVRAARVADASGLPEAEQRAALAQQLDERLREAEVRIADVGDGRELPALIAETADVDPIAAKMRAADLREELDSLGEEVRQIDRDLGSVEAGLSTFGGGAAAAEASAEAQEHLATVKALGHRWVRTHLAAVILRREIERYRAENQGPILGRAAQLFPRLTLGEYRTLRTSLDDDVLECVKAGGTTVRVEQLSDGARDALYLALRLASLDHYARTAEPMPLVLDDVLITLDDERTRAAVEVLGEVAALTQVILFTHHAHVVKIARKVLGPRLVEHTIERPRSRAQQVLPLD